MGKRPDKIQDQALLPLIKAAANTGNYRETYHQRIENVGKFCHTITRLEVEQILLFGHREPARDRFEPYDTWSYSLRGKTIDKREIRAALAVYAELVIIA